MVDDIVLVKDEDLPRNKWNMGYGITQIFVGDGELVRSANIRLSSSKTIIHRSIIKLVLLIGSDEQ